MKNITYAIDNDGMIYSRFGDRIAFMELNYDAMQPANQFAMTYKIADCPIFDLSYYWDNLKWTKKIPLAIKNIHREYWGMKLLK